MKNFDLNELDLYNDLKSNSESSDRIKELFEYLCLCHNVKVKITTVKTTQTNINDGINGEDERIRESTTSEKKFNSSVAEEKAMLKTLKKFGYLVDKISNKEISLLINGEVKHYNILGHNRYTEERNRMSIIVKAHKMDKESILLCKANDLSIFNLLKNNDNEKQLKAISNQIKSLANIGYRYFIFCKKRLSEDQTTEFLSKYKLAENYVLQKEVLFDNVYI